MPVNLPEWAASLWWWNEVEWMILQNHSSICDESIYWHCKVQFFAAMNKIYEQMCYEQNSVNLYCLLLTIKFHKDSIFYSKVFIGAWWWRLLLAAHSIIPRIMMIAVAVFIGAWWWRLLLAAHSIIPRIMMIAVAVCIGA